MRDVEIILIIIVLFTAHNCKSITVAIDVDLKHIAFNYTVYFYIINLYCDHLLFSPFYMFHPLCLRACPHYAWWRSATWRGPKVTVCLDRRATWRGPSGTVCLELPPVGVETLEE